MVLLTDAFISSLTRPSPQSVIEKTSSLKISRNRVNSVDPLKGRCSTKAESDEKFHKVFTQRPFLPVCAATSRKRKIVPIKSKQVTSQPSLGTSFLGRIQKASTLKPQKKQYLKSFQASVHFLYSMIRLHKDLQPYLAAEDNSHELFTKMNDLIQSIQRIISSAQKSYLRAEDQHREIHIHVKKLKPLVDRLEELNCKFQTHKTHSGQIFSWPEKENFSSIDFELQCLKKALWPSRLTFIR